MVAFSAASRRRATPSLGLGLGLTLLGCSVFAVGCEDARGPELIQVHRLSPERAAVSDRILVTGEGFPDGRSATVTFRGDLFRPGGSPERDVSLTARAAPTAQNALSFALEPALERRFVGRGGGALHTTFHGDVRVVFDAGARGGIPIFGTLRDVTFDVLPTAAIEPSDPAASTELATALGLSGTPEPSGTGFRLTAVVPDGRAGTAGLRAGDVLLAEDGVTVLDLPDLAPESGKRSARLTVLRDGRVLPGLALDVDGVSPLGVAALAWPAVVLAFALTAFALVRGAFGRTVALVLASREGGPLASRKPQGKALGAAVAALVEPIATTRELAAAAALVLALVLVGIVRLATRRVLVSPDLDLFATSLSAIFALVLARFAAGGVDGRSWSLRAATAALGRTLVCVAPALLSLLGAVLASGRFVLSELVADQGAAPLRWAVARNPGLFVLGLVLLATTVPSAKDLPATARSGGSRLLRTLVRLSEWSYLWVVAALFVVVFAGGYRVPGITSSVQEASTRWSLLGAAFAIAKVSVTALGVAAVRNGLGRPTTTDASEIALRVGAPLSLASTVIAAAWSAAIDTAPSAGLPELAARTSALTVAAFAGYSVLVATRPPRPAASPLNPWL
ncbi:MAG TPA: PDZ domain-containing protein [Polyangiaceae bacterium]|nr:PDZ domain-containing protein [Polyangiaceae bacterium]